MIARDIIRKENAAFIKRMAVLVIASIGIIAGLYNGVVSLGVFVLLALYIVSTRQIQNTYEVLFFLLPFANVFKVTYGTPSLVTALQLVTLFRLLFLTRKLSVSTNSLALGILFIIYCILCAPAKMVTILLFSVNILFLLSSMMREVSNNLEVGKIIIAFSLALLIAAVYSFLKEYITPLGEYITDTLYRLEDKTALDRLSGLYENPNYFSIDISMAMAGIYCSYMRKDIGAKIFYPCEIILLILGIMTQSSSFMIALIVFAVWVFFSMCRNRNVELVRVAVIAIILCVICMPIMERTILPYLTRFTDKVEVLQDGGDINDFTTNRIDLWINYLSDITSDTSGLIFGKGYGAVFVSDMRAHDSHNAFVQMLYCFGIVGSVIYICFFLSIIHVRDRRNSGAYSSIFLIVLLVRCFTANIAVYDNLFYYIVIAYLLQQKIKVVGRKVYFGYH